MRTPVFSRMLSLPTGEETISVPVYTCNTLVVGSGAAALNCAHTLASLGVSDVILATEGMKMGTSRNTGSDKQTYYKVSTAAERPDSARKMAEVYFDCGAMHGDIALVEALGSLRSFFKLVSLGVPFPHSALGEYTGYRTGHDESCRATSCGPLTSKYMTEALEKAVRAADVPILDGCRIIELLYKETNGVRCCTGAVAFDATKGTSPSRGLAVIEAVNVVWGVGGPSSVYATSVYPESQTCALGTALLAGASGVNMTESQYGLASLSFRWNVSGSYQQVLPRYVSVDADGVERELLPDVFPRLSDCMTATFRKGYEWPFDPAKLSAGARSSLVDLAVFCERQKGRRVYMDFRKNPAGLTAITPDTVGQETYDYLKSSASLGKTPIVRLRQMNEQAYQLYLSHGIDLECEMLEVGVCAQHCNGGLESDVWFESPSLRHFFPVGEAGGVFGIRRPGGSALNDTQVSSARAAERIAAVYTGEPTEVTADQLTLTKRYCSLLSAGGEGRGPALAKRLENGRLMDASGAFLRNPAAAEKALATLRCRIDGFFTENTADNAFTLLELVINYDSLVTSAAMLASVLAYVRDGGLSRGSYVITDKSAEDLVRDTSGVVCDTVHRGVIGRVSALSGSGISFGTAWVPVRPIPSEDNWFETVMRQFREGEIYR
ncbi:MAG: FAD-binding protein [Clostridia bacterium]|nr:FAD-binding protein [Clostridia bacterium]